MERNPALFESLLQNCDEFRVILARDVIEHFDDGHLRANRGKVTREFEPDDTAADDDEVLRLFGEREDFAVRADKPACEPFLQAGNRRYCRG
ncbi:hypothetical protein SDC9_154412 [bioreactor metagenome]|uniref:Uncharacterized protein n=1 Tax=bioreactor metagenome TaxID=1076179 RepID=A0A645F0E2_9ZZZZ